MREIELNSGIKLKITSWDDHLDSKYGKIGFPERIKFEFEAKAFIKSELEIEEKRKLKSKTKK